MALLICIIECLADFFALSCLDREFERNQVINNDNDNICTILGK